MIVDQKDGLQHQDTFGILDNPKIDHVCGSILDSETFEVSFEADHVIHTAGFLGVQNVADHPALTMDVNILGTRNCLDYARRQPNLRRVVTFSTSEVFGTYAKKASEGDPALIPTDGYRWCYSTSKLAAEQYTKAYWKDHEVPYTIVRPFNIYGPHRFGSNAVSRFTEAALDGETITIEGNGLQRRAWCYIDDFTKSVLETMASESGRNEDFNLGNPLAECSVLELAQEVVALADSNSPVVVTGSQIEDVFERSPSIDKLTAKTGFVPSVSLRAGLKYTIEWLRSEQV